MSLETFRLLDELAANAWPAPIQQGLESWRLRSSGGVTRRASSVLTIGPVPQYADWLAYIEDFYRKRGLPTRFQISDGSPPELDALLEERGYRVEVRTMVKVAPAAEVAARSAHQSGLPVIETSLLTEEWLDAFMLVEGFPEGRKAAYRSIYSAIGPDALYVRSSSHGQTVGVGMAVTERGWTGIFSVATMPEQRRQGIATLIMHRLALWSMANSAPNLYLQVLKENEKAVSLYSKLGFETLYGYHYRTKE